MAKIVVYNIQWDVDIKSPEINNMLRNIKQNAYVEFLHNKEEEDRYLKQTGQEVDDEDREYNNFEDYFDIDNARAELVETHLGLPKKCVLNLQDNYDKDTILMALKDKYGYDAKEGFSADKAKPHEIAKQNMNDAVRDIISGDKFKEYLDMGVNFRNYSVNNKMLVFAQKPDATLVKGMGAWRKDYERNIQKGAKQIWIYRPSMKTFEGADKVDAMVEWIDKHNKTCYGEFTISDSKKEESIRKLLSGEKVNLLIGYNVMPVYDVSDTFGKELPMLESKSLSDKEIEANIKDLMKQFNMHCKKMNDKDVDIFATLEYLANKLLEAEIPAIPGIMRQQAFNDTIKNIECSAIAYSVCKSIGLQPADSSLKTFAQYLHDDPIGTRELLFNQINERIDKSVKYFLKEYDKIATKNKELASLEAETPIKETEIKAENENDITIPDAFMNKEDDDYER